MIKYPAAIDTQIELPYVVDNVTPISEQLINNLRDAIVAIEAELGVKPSGIYSNVRSRLNALELSLNGGSMFGGDLETVTPFTQKVIGLQGNAISSTSPTDGYVLTWDQSNNNWEPKLAIGSGTPGGSNTQIQFNDSGNFGGDSGLTYNKTTDVLTATNITVSSVLKIQDSSGGQFYTFVASNLAADCNITLPLLTSNDVMVTEAHPQTLTNKTINASNNTISNIANAHISSSAAIAYSKLNLANSIVNSDIGASAAIAGTKISPDFGSQNAITTGSIEGASFTVGSSGPTITKGTGAPVSTPGNGSIYLRTDGTSTTGIYTRQGSSWSAVGNTAGSDTHVQFNDNGVFGANSGFIYDKIGVVTLADALAVGASPANLGAIRLSNQFGIAQRNVADDADLGVLQAYELDGYSELSLGTFNNGDIGETFERISICVQDIAYFWINNEVAPFQVGKTVDGVIGTFLPRGSNLAVCGNRNNFLGTDFGGGEGVIFLGDGYVIPTSNPEAGIIIYAEGETLKYRQSDGTIVTLDGATGGTPGGSDTHIQFNDSGNFGGDAGLTYNKTTNVLSISDALALGSDPSSSGYLRLTALTGADRSLLTVKMGAFGSDADIIVANSSDALVYFGSPDISTYYRGFEHIFLSPDGNEIANFRGSSGDYFSFGSSPASAGVLRLPTTFTINARNNADNADLPVLRTDTIDNLYLGTTSSWSGGPQVAALHTYVTSAGQINIGTGSTTRLQITSSGVNLYNADPLTFGSSGAAASGLIRLPNTGAIKARNTGNSADYNLINLDNSNYVTIGNTSQTFIQLGATSNDALLNDANGQIFRASSGSLVISRPISQSRTTNSSTGTLNDVSIGDNFHIEFTNATGPTVTGFTGGVAGRILYVTFTAEGIITHQSGSTTANQIKTGSGLDISVAAGETIQFIYDAANSRWLPVGVGI